MSDVKVTEVLALPNDVLLVRGTAKGHTQTVEKPVLDKDGKQKFEGRGRNRRPVVKSVKEPVVFTAQGWRSALQNHYPPEAYDENGELKLKPHSSKPGQPRLGDPEHDAREMTPDEIRAYCEGLLRDVVEQTPQDLTHLLG